MNSRDFTAELAGFLDSSCSVGVWEWRENSDGAVIREAMRLEPGDLPDGWMIEFIAGSSVWICREEPSDEQLVAVDRDALDESVSDLKGKLEGDVSRFGPDGTGYDVDAFVTQIETLESALEGGTER